MRQNRCPRCHASSSGHVINAASSGFTWRIAIDAGPWSFDNGTVGPHGVREKDAVLDVALRTAILVHRLMGIDVILTREDDRFVSLQQRTALPTSITRICFYDSRQLVAPASTSGPETFFLNLSGVARSRCGAT